jgi:hypothetical protein
VDEWETINPSPRCDKIVSERKAPCLAA